jgi:hypothetical protein
MFRAEREEARQAGHGDPESAAVGMRVLWVSALPMDAKVARPDRAQAALIAGTPA